jgi:hypothetical protein
MSWRFRGKEVAGTSGALLVSTFVMAVTSPSTVNGDTPRAVGPSNATEAIPPGALIMRGPNAGASRTSTANTDASSAISVVPTSLRLPPDLAEVVRLQSAGIGEDTILAFIQDSPPLTPLTPEQIVYLKDLGVSPRVLTAMIQHQRPTPGGTAPAAGPAFPGAEVATVPEYPAEMGTEATVPTLPPGYDETAALPGPGYFNPVDYGYVYNALAPYGSWFNMPGFGWCWQPTVCSIRHGWRPYCDNGNWRWSDCGWYWDSKYTWGQVPFHYGRWWQHAQQGWLWCPDRVWAPAWVSWRSSKDLCGWAPLPPGANFSMVSGWTYRGRPTDPTRGGFGLTPDAYTFVDQQHFLMPAGHSLGTRETQDAFSRSKPVDRNGFVFGANQRIVNQGIDPFRVETAARKPIQSAAMTVRFPGGAGFSERGSAGQLPFSPSRRTDRSGGNNAATAQGSAEQPSGTVWSKPSPWSPVQSRSGHVPQYSETHTLADLGDGSGQAKGPTPTAGGPRATTGSKPANLPNAPAAGTTVVYPFAKPAAIAPVPAGAVRGSAITVRK